MVGRGHGTRSNTTSRSARPGDKVVDPSELARVLDLYGRIKFETAGKVVEHWRLDPDYLFALKPLNAQRKAGAPVAAE